MFIKLLYMCMYVYTCMYFKASFAILSFRLPMGKLNLAESSHFETEKVVVKTEC